MDLRGFKGWRFCGGADDEISKFIAPPYDILSADDKTELLSLSDKNIVAVDLPHVPPKDVGPDGVYQRSAELLSEWKASGVLRQEQTPAIYLYEQTFSWAGKEYTRRAMICGVRATELGKDIIPHEHTFEGPKADRLKLTEYTQTQLSPIFGFYNDPAGRVAELLAEAPIEGSPCRGKLKEVDEKISAITDEEIIAAIANTLRSEPVFIADGHHRCTTAMNYSRALREAGQIDENNEANYVMFVLVAKDDPGLLVLPTHRVLQNLAENFTIQNFINKIPEFEWNRCSVEQADLSDADSFLHRYGPHAMAFMGADPAEIWIGKLTDADAMVKLAPDEKEVWRNLDVAILHKLIIDKALAPWRGDDLFIEYTPDGRAVLAACQSGRAQLGICLQGTPAADVEAIALAGATMPHKSTYFYPKVATGMVLKPME